MVHALALLEQAAGVLLFAVIGADVFPRGDISLSSSSLAGIGQGMTRLKEPYHIHPMLFYFRSATVRFSPARFLLIAFDTVTLVRTALAEDLAIRVGTSALALAAAHRGPGRLHGVHARGGRSGGAPAGRAIMAPWRARRSSCCC